MPKKLTALPVSLTNLSRFRYLLIIISAVLLLLPFLEIGSQPPSDWIYFLGRFHPLIIHFPIVLLSLLLVLELINRSRWKVMTNYLRGVLLALAVLSSLVAVTLGYLLYLTGDYSGDIVETHLWLGIGVAVGSLFLLYFWLDFSIRKKNVSLVFYGSILFLTNGLLVLASHQGGSLTHGTDYLTDYLPSFKSIPEKPVEEMLVYQDVIVPMLDAKCFSCHNEHKSKGDLLLTSLSDMALGGKSGQPGLVAGHVQQSEIYQRVTLPPTHDDFMPPDGKPSLTPTEVKLLSWWIEEGADPDLDYLTALKDSSVSLTLQNYVSELSIARRRQWKDEQEINDLVQQVSVKEAPFIVKRNEENPLELTLQMPFPPGAFGNQDLINLRPVFEKFTKVNLVSSDISDDALYHLGQMKQLRELSLQKTKVDGSGLVYLTALPLLEKLNLSQTQMSDANLLYLTKMPALKEVYLYETPVSPSIVEILQAHLPNLNIYLTRSPS